MRCWQLRPAPPLAPLQCQPPLVQNNSVQECRKGHSGAAGHRPRIHLDQHHFRVLGLAGAGVRIDQFQQGAGFRPTAFRQQRWGQPGDRVRALYALPPRETGGQPLCVALVETGAGPTLKQALLLWNGASWVPKVRRAHGGATWEAGMRSPACGMKPIRWPWPAQAGHLACPPSNCRALGHKVLLLPCPRCWFAV